MADAQRIYPANEDVEKAEQMSLRPSALAPKSSLMSEKEDPAANRGQLRDVTFPKEQMIPSRQPHRYYPGPPRRRRNTCCRCLVWTFCLIVLLIVTIVIAAAILYAVFKPKIPNYSVDNIQITRFFLGAGATVSSQFAVDVTARNPNKKIGIYYLDDSYLAVFYTGTELCKGKLPAFYQGHRNTTNLDVTLTGTDVQITSDMVRSLTAQRQLVSIPLLVKADVPVKVKFGKLKTMKITFRVRCDL
ncbi:hypothetical protein SUGI_0716570 [Cryptomeria japonica]|nr:hypothetical protein SUGI_0716570 [Cryptomeria japonica]